MLLHELNYGAYQNGHVGSPYTHRNLQGCTHLSGYAAPAAHRVLYDGLGNPVGILPFIAALAPLAMKALTALPAIAGKAATLLPQMTSAVSTLMPAPSAAAITPQQALPPMPMPAPPMAVGPMPPMPMPLPAIETVNVPMRENDGRLVMVQRRLVRRGRRRRSMVSQPAMAERFPVQQRSQNLQGWSGWQTY
jgi:hypothetical protein